MEKKMLIYFETSAVNFLFNRMTIGDAIATSKYQLNKGKIWCISPVVLWEIMQTTNDDKKEKLLEFCQHLFREKLLVSPSEIIINYIRNGCPKIEPYYDPISNAAIANIWREMCEIPAKTIIYDKSDLKDKVKIIREVMNSLDALVKGDNELSGQNLINKTTIEQVLWQTKFFQEDKDKIDSEQYILYLISTFFILTTLCGCADVDPEPITFFWQEVGAKCTKCKLEYILAKYEELFYRGPFIEMALMAYHQNLAGSTRGLYFDCLHSLYFPYVQIVFSCDDHFEILKRKAMHPNFLKLQMLTDNNFGFVVK